MGRVILRIDGREEQLSSGVHRLSEWIGPGAQESKIRVEGGRAYLEDSAGVFVNGDAPAGPLLKEGDRITPAEGGGTVEVISIQPEPPASIPCPMCGEPVKPQALKCPHCRTFLKHVPGRSEPSAPERDLKTEAHFLALGFWFRVFGALGAAAGVLLGFGMIVSPRDVLGFKGAIGLIIAGVVVALSALGFFIGHGLSQFRNWARVTTGVLSVLSVALNALSAITLAAGVNRAGGAERGGNWFGILVNLALYTAIAATMLGRRATSVCAEEYRRSMAETSGLRASMFSSGYFWVYAIVLGIVGLAILMVAVTGAAMSR
jgi:hypothetical protein